MLFHHAHGLTRGVLEFAERLREAGHTVHTPDLYRGETFPLLADGIQYAKETGFDTVIERGRAAAAELPREIVYGGFSLGVLPAQMLAQTRGGAKGALLYHAAIPLSEFGGEWPRGVPGQIHVMENDELGDVDVAQELVATVDELELLLYSGDRHLFADSSLADYDEPAATLLEQRTLRFLEQLA